MKIAQLIVLPFDCDMDHDDWMHAAKQPNPLFLSVCAAMAAAQDDVNADLAEQDALVLADDLVWTLTEDNVWTASNEDTGTAYAIHEVEVGA